MEKRELFSIIRRRLYWIATAEALFLLLGFLSVGLILSAFGIGLTLFLPVGFLLSIAYLIIRILNHHTDYKIALLVEKSHPEMKERLISLVELEGKSFEREGYSQFLMERLREEVGELLKGVKIKEVIGLRSFPFRFFYLSSLIFLFLFSLFTTDYLKEWLGEKFPPLFVVYPGDTQYFEGTKPIVYLSLFGGSNATLYLMKGKETLVFSSSGDQVIKFDLPPLKIGDYKYFVRVEESTSDTYKLSILEIPYFKYLSVRIRYPPYTGLGEEIFDEPTFLTPLEGSRLIFGGEFEGADSFKVFLDDEVYAKIENITFNFDFTAKDPTLVSFEFYTANLNRKGLRKIRVNPIHDSPPSVHITEPAGDIEVPEDMRVFIRGYAEDDLGLKSSQLVYVFEDTGRIFIKEFKPGTLLDSLGIDFDLTTLSLLPGDEVYVYLEVEDIKGQRAKSSEIRIRFPTPEEIYEEFAEATESGERFASSLMEKARKMVERIEEIEELFKREKSVDWAKREKVREILQEQKKLLGELEERLRELEEDLEKFGASASLDYELLEKIEEVRQLFEETMTEELRKALERLEEALKKLNPKDIEKALYELKINEEMLKESLERTAEILKRYRQELELERLAELAERLASMQRELLERMERAESSEELTQLAKEEELLREELKELQKRMEELGEEIEDDTTVSESLKEISEEEVGQASSLMQSASQSLSSGDKSNAMKSGRMAEMKLGQIAMKLKNLRESLVGSRMAELLEEMQGVLGELLFLSEEQEELISKLSGGMDPLELASKEEGIRRGAERIMEQLVEISKKTFFVSPRLIATVSQAAKRMEGARDMMKELRQGPALRIAEEGLLLLNLAAYQLLQSQSACSKGCSSTGFEEAMQQMAQAAQMQASIMRQSQSLLPLPLPSTEELARIAAEQEAVRRMIEEIRESLMSEEGLLRALEAAEKEAEEVKRELEEGRLTREIIRKQERILSRLLEAQRSIRKRGFRRERISRPGKEYMKTPPPELQLAKERERIRRALLDLRRRDYPPEIKRLIEAYYKTLLED
jgi:hypothetical protein